MTDETGGMAGNVAGIAKGAKKSGAAGVAQGARASGRAGNTAGNTAGGMEGVADDRGATGSMAGAAHDAGASSAAGDAASVAQGASASGATGGGGKKAAIVTGGSRGIGFACALRLARDGFNIAVMATGAQSACAGRLRMIEEAGAECLYVSGSIASAADRERLVSETAGRFGGIHVLVNNAGVAPIQRADLLDMSEESFDRVIGINTKGTMFLTQAVARQMMRQGYEGAKRGTVINISSCSAEVSSTGRGEYCVSKAGMSMLTLLYADRLAAEGIYVHEVRPGVIDTDMTSAVRAKYDALIEGGAFPIARWGSPEDVAGAVSAFAGDAFLYTTGNYVDVDGGFHIRRL